MKLNNHEIFIDRVNGYSYYLEDTKLLVLANLQAGISYVTSIESSGGVEFKVGESKTTTLVAKLFKNGVDITTEVPAFAFRWRRVSVKERVPPNDDTTWNTSHAAGYKQITINTDEVSSRATFFCDIIIQ
jgi:hypothetical protein